MMVLALDPATLTGVADGEPGGTPRLSVVRLRHDPDDETDDLFRRAAEWLWRRIATEPPDVMAIELPVPPHRARGVTQHSTTVLTMGLYGLFVGIARARGIKVVHAHIATWRKCVLGKGNLPGDQAKRAMLMRCKQLGWNAPDHNAAEAAGIWLWACGAIR